MIGHGLQSRFVHVLGPKQFGSERWRKPTMVHPKAIACAAIPSEFASRGMQGSPSVGPANGFQCLEILCSKEGTASFVDQVLARVEIADEQTTPTLHLRRQRQKFVAPKSRLLRVQRKVNAAQL